MKISIEKIRFIEMELFSRYIDFKWHYQPLFLVFWFTNYMDPFRGMYTTIKLNSITWS